MSIATQPIRRQCQHKSQCANDATWGLFAWKPAETDVNMNKPIAVLCGPHKNKVILKRNGPAVRWARLLT